MGPQSVSGAGIREDPGGLRIRGPDGVFRLALEHDPRVGHGATLLREEERPRGERGSGRIGDGVILQFADPALIKWCLGFVREGAEEAGRDFSKIRVMSAAPVWVSDNLAKARDQVRWFPALVSNHIVDLVSRYKPEELPEELTSYIRGRKGYNYLHHAEVGSSNAAFVTDEIVDRFCIVGPAEEHVRKLKELQNIGVTQFNIYLMSDDEEQTVEAYGRDVVTCLR